jgi:tricarballylate dehydrogenase
MDKYEYDIVVVGHGMAGLSAGLRAAELDQEVVVIEKTAKDECGGQTAYSESFRVPSADTDLNEWGYEFDVPDYTVEEFYEDIMERTNGHANSDLARTLVENAGPAIEWLTEHGVDWEMEPLAVGYTAGRTWFDNDELVAHLADEIESFDGDIHYETSARRLLDEDGHVIGLEAAQGEGCARFNCEAVILACGGYESSPEKRARYYGSGYDDMKVRGSGYNTGEAIEMALDAGANAAGQWSGAHMALIDANSPDVGGGANRVDGTSMASFSMSKVSAFLTRARMPGRIRMPSSGGRSSNDPGIWRTSSSTRKRRTSLGQRDPPIHTRQRR